MNIVNKFLLGRHKNNKFIYYFKNILRYYLSRFIRKNNPPYQILENEKYIDEYIMSRVNYYNKLQHLLQISPESVTLKEFQLPVKKKGHYSNRVYFFDTFQYTRYFTDSLRIKYEFGDVTFVPSMPTIVKSRPINCNNENSVILNLDKVRHFNFIKDKKKFIDKKNMLIGRAYVTQPHRIKFMDMYFNHPMCDLGQINIKDTDHPEWIVKPISIEKHLEYKFILCIEGNDVASNLKWVMSSNSLAVMPKPTYETWFMEGTLIPNYHYIEIKKDYSDLEEKLNYYINHTDKALEIIMNAHHYISQFQNRKREDLISLLVLNKYFEKTSQIEQLYWK